MKKLLVVYKPVGITPLQAIESFKEKHPEYRSKKMGYAGRLDPMAEGLLLILVGEEGRNIGKYLKLDKQYRAKILFGFSTDSYDILGISEPGKTTEDVDIKELKRQIKSFRGIYSQEIPAFSSYRIRGKSLFHYARINKLPAEMPEKRVNIKDVKINSIYTTNGNQLLKEITRKIALLKGDFRQEQITEQWKKLLEKNKETKYLVADITLDCSSGTYIRAIAEDLGKRMKCGSVLLNLIRTRIGKFQLKDSIR